MRIYLPLTMRMLRGFASRGQCQPIGGVVFAVTPGLRAEYPAADDEELEYLAMADGARASLRLVGAEDGASGWLRVVAAADVTEVTEQPDRDRAAALVSGPVQWSWLASVHVDGAEEAAVIEAAARAVDAADLGDLDAEMSVGDAEDIDLAWYAPGEVMFLLEDLDRLE